MEGNYQLLSVCECECVSYVVVVHELSALTSQSAGEKLSRFNGRWGQFRTTLEQETIESTSVYLDLKHIKSTSSS